MPSLNNSSTTMVGQLVKHAVVLVGLYFVSNFVVLTFWRAHHPATTTTRDADNYGMKAKPKLSFSSKDQRFRILQLTDMHLGEDVDSDRKTYNMLRKIIPLEHPDLIVLGGDQLTAKLVDDNATAYYDELAEFCESFRIPHALVFGNHDDADRQLGGEMTEKAKTSRTQLLQSNQRFSHSLSEVGPASVSGVSNYMLPVYFQNKLKLQVIFMDSGGGSLPQEITESQLGDWYRSNRQKGVDAVAFQHIPTRTFQYDNSSTCTGFVGKHGVLALKYDPMDEVATLKEQDPRLRFLAVGHNHWNSYCCPTTSSKNSLHFCFGRHSGYGGYGTEEWARGGRVYDITLTENSEGGTHTVQWKSWVRIENGEIEDEYNPAL